MKNFRFLRQAYLLAVPLKGYPSERVVLAESIQQRLFLSFLNRIQPVAGIYK